MTEALIGVGVTLFLNIVAFSFWLGRIHQKVNHLCNDMSHVREDIKRLSDRLDEYGERISKLEGKLEE